MDKMATLADLIAAIVRPKDAAGEPLAESALHEIGSMELHDHADMVAALVDERRERIEHIRRLATVTRYGDRVQLPARALAELDRLWLPTYTEYLDALEVLETPAGSAEQIAGQVAQLKGQRDALRARLDALDSRENAAGESYRARLAVLAAQQDAAKTSDQARIIAARIEGLRSDTPASITEQRRRLGQQLTATEWKLAALTDSFDTLTHDPTLSKLRAVYDRRSTSPDWPGYLAFLAAADSPLRRLFFHRLPVWIPESDRARHTYISGASGSGKTELLKILVYSYLRRPWFGLAAGEVERQPLSIVALDPAGDFPLEIAKWPEVASNPAQTILIDPTLSKTHTPRLNPFDQLPAGADDRTIANWAEYLAGAFADLAERGGYGDATGNMRVLLLPCLHVLLRRAGSTIQDLQDFMAPERNAALLALGCQLKNPTHAGFFRDRFNSRNLDRARDAVFNRLQQVLQSDTLRHMLVGPSTVKLAEAVNSGRLVLVRLPKGGAGIESGPTMGILLTSLLQAIAFDRYETPPHMRVPVHFFVDECQNYINGTLKEILDELRKFGLHLTLANQHTGQLPEPIRESVLTNSAVLIAGITAAQSVNRLANEFGIKGDELRALKTGQFFLKRKGPEPARRFAVPVKLLKDSHRAEPEVWRAFVAYQLATYYAPITGGPPPGRAPETTPDGLADGANTLLIPSAPRRKKSFI